LARNLSGAKPAEALRFNSWRIWSRIVRATKVAVDKHVLFSVTSRSASSSDSDSTGPCDEDLPHAAGDCPIACEIRSHEDASGHKCSARIAGTA
jgi:hypothetical protein